ncbi:MAG: HepT-like ribonuclease domain-containing protein [Candidatus Eremiobacterota bacterium]
MRRGRGLPARLSERRPEDILTLGRQGVLPMAFAEKISAMAQFRNVLVHAYLHINRGLVYDFLSRLDDFDTFARHVEAWLNP